MPKKPKQPLGQSSAMSDAESPAKQVDLKAKCVRRFYGTKKPTRKRAVSFAEMSLGEVFDVEQKHTANLGG